MKLLLLLLSNLRTRYAELRRLRLSRSQCWAKLFKGGR